MIKAITFDLDDTLWDIWPVVERAEQLLHDWLAARYPRMAAQFTPLELRDLSAEVIAARPNMAHDRTWLRKAALNLAARRVGYREFDVDSAFEVFFIARNAVEPFADVRPTLERLARRYTLASLSNGNADLRLIGLHDVCCSFLAQRHRRGRGQTGTVDVRTGPPTAGGTTRADRPCRR
jgi:FMN phosphatase YigB (HAD superfamily)